MSEKRKKTGRPEIDEEERKTKRVTVCLNREELNLISAKAEAAGLTASSYLLRLGLSKKFLPAPPAVNFEMLEEINGVSCNLDKLVKNFKAENPSFDDLEKNIEELQKTIGEIRMSLIGASAYVETEDDENNDGGNRSEISK